MTRTPYTRDEALALGHPTYILDPSQISVNEVAGYPNELYLFNWITDEDKRGQGHGGRLLRAVCDGADRTDTTLVTHPDDERLQATLERYGFELDDSRVDWEDKPFMSRKPRLFEPEYEIANHP